MEKNKETVMKSINLNGKRRLLSSIKGWELIKIRKNNQSFKDQQLIDKIRVTLSKEVIEWEVTNDNVDVIEKLDNYFGLL